MSASRSGAPAGFLSDAWFAALERRPVGTDPALTFRLDQVVTGTPAGDVRYRVTVEGGTARVERDPEGAADAVLRMSYRTAADLASGKRTAHDAFVKGEVRFSGDPRKLQELAAVLGPVSAAFGGAAG